MAKIPTHEDNTEDNKGGEKRVYLGNSEQPGLDRVGNDRKNWNSLESAGMPG